MSPGLTTPTTAAARTRTGRAHPRGIRALVFCLLAMLMACLGCDRTGAAPQSQSAPRPPVKVTLAPLTREPVDRTVDVVGSLFADEQSMTSAKVAGRILRTRVDIGDRVAPGQELLQIDPTDYQLAVAQRKMGLQEALAKLGLTALPTEDFDVAKIPTVERARFQAANAKAKLDRARQLFERQPPLISEQDYQDLETAFEVATRDRDVAELEARAQLALARTRASELAAAQQRLDDTTVRAPYGESPTTRPMSLKYAVTQRRVSAGEYVREGDALIELIIDNPIRFRVSVPERYLAEINVGQTALVRVESYARPFQGQVRRINPAIDQQSRAFQVEVEVPNDAGELRPGAFARGVIVTGKDANVRFVPKRAVLAFAGVDRVFSVKNGKAVEHVVTLGAEREDRVAILGGLADEDSVVVEGIERLAQDVPVEVSTPPATSG